MSKRQYKQKQRADQQEQTRERIVRATMELHETVGPRNTTITAIAERAGVQRLTVYRHFEDEDSLFLACSGLWLELNPPPQPQSWMSIADREKRIQTALTLFYNYYSTTRQMWHGVYRDMDDVASLRQSMKKLERYMEAVYDSLLVEFATEITPQLRQTLVHGLRFSTWQSLDAEGIKDTEKVKLAMAWLSCWWK